MSSAQLRLHTVASSGALVYAGLVLAGCFNKPNEFKCTDFTHCPSGYQCVVPDGTLTGICRKPVDAGTPDVVAPIDIAIGIDVTPPVEHPPAVDVAIPVIDGPGISDVAPGLDTSSAQDTAPDVLSTADLGANVMPDAPSPPDTAQDNSVVGLDTAPDVSPDTAPPAPDLGPDLPVLKPLGASCTLANECANNFCAGGVCCNRSCTGACEECTAASGGQCTYKSGTVCSSATDCTDAALCSGTSSTCPARPPKKSGTLCGNVTCSGNTQSASTCDGAGDCGARTNLDCWPYACTSGTGCKTSCTASTDCVAENAVFCGAAGQCRTENGCWRDLTTNLLWQVNPDPNYHQLADAKTLCANLSLCGFDDWALPTIDELRSLVRGCPNGLTGGACGVTNSCLVDTCDANCVACDNMLGPSSGCYQDPQLGGPCGGYWSLSTYTSTFYGSPSTRVREADFAYGTLKACDPTDGNYVRCDRR